MGYLVSIPLIFCQGIHCKQNFCEKRKKCIFLKIISHLFSHFSSHLFFAPKRERYSSVSHVLLSRWRHSTIQRQNYPIVAAHIFLKSLLLGLEISLKNPVFCFKKKHLQNFILLRLLKETWQQT